MLKRPPYSRCIDLKVRKNEFYSSSCSCPSLKTSHLKFSISVAECAFHRTGEDTRRIGKRFSRSLALIFSSRPHADLPPVRQAQSLILYCGQRNARNEGLLAGWDLSSSSMTCGALYWFVYIRTAVLDYLKLLIVQVLIKKTLKMKMMMTQR